jgi:molybdenum cofactor cytidylyltransferase
MIWAILLAAGESRRMGDFKQLLHFRGKSFVLQCVDTLLASSVDGVCVVTGYRHEEIESELAGLNILLAHNKEFREGMSSSIKTGLAAIKGKASAILISLADQPQIRVQTINLIVSTYKNTHPVLVIPVYDGRKGHPIILDERIFREIQELDSNEGLRTIVNAHLDQAVLVKMDTDEILKDYDTPSDLISNSY